MRLSNIDSSLSALIANINPAVKTADCHISPVSGLTGESWRITGPDIDWLAREQSPQKSQLGVNRRRERKFLQHIAGSGLSPAVIAADRRWLVVNWLEGDVVTNEQFVPLASYGQLARLLTRLHHLPASGYRLDLRTQIARYGALIDPARRSPDGVRLQHDFLRRRLPAITKLAPLHMDIHPGNLLATPVGLKLIDWEYAADGDIALEIAALFRGNRWSKLQQQAFLQDYCNYEHGYHDIARLSRQIQQWLPWVDYLMLMWFEVRWQQTADPIFLEWAAPLRQRFNLSF
ncbi:thiamine kinase [Yersinia similis]|uniref:Thiamine kinase n=1 Tax=Yersinia similis TaxID=367190 RepID=A0ABN4CRQ8_9GAMM|nr:thiamine kinase [Yersinia similis]AHK21582.1 thiamine kinase [Yersinia similis]CFQ50080.1 thiamine kinase [Yersinia similis]